MLRGEPKKNQDALQSLFTDEHMLKQWEKEHEAVSKLMKKRSTIRSGHGGVGVFAVEKISKGHEICSVDFVLSAPPGGGSYSFGVIVATADEMGASAKL